MTTVPVVVIQKMLEDYGGDLKKKTENKITYKIKNIIVNIPNVKDVDFEYLESIALDQLDMSNWDLDDWLGKNFVAPKAIFHSNGSNSSYAVAAPLEEE